MTEGGRCTRLLLAFVVWPLRDGATEIHFGANIATYVSRFCGNFYKRSTCLLQTIIVRDGVMWHIEQRRSTRSRARLCIYLAPWRTHPRRRVPHNRRPYIGRRRNLSIVAEHILPFSKMSKSYVWEVWFRTSRWWGWSIENFVGSFPPCGRRCCRRRRLVLVHLTSMSGWARKALQRSKKQQGAIKLDASVSKGVSEIYCTWGVDCRQRAFGVQVEQLFPRVLNRHQP